MIAGCEVQAATIGLQSAGARAAFSTLVCGDEPYIPHLTLDVPAWHNCTTNHDDQDSGYDFHRIQEKWLPIWDKLKPFDAQRPGRQASPQVRARHVLRTRPATCTWDTPRPSRSATSRRATGASRASTCCTRSAGTRSACPPRTPPSSAASTRASGPTPTSSSSRRRCKPLRRLVRLGPRTPHERPRVLQVEPVAVPQDVREGPRLPQGLLGQLGPGRPDRARQRAGAARRHIRSLRRRRRQEEAHAVVLQDHRLRRPPARRPEPARGIVARQGARHAAQLDRPLARRRRRVRGRGSGRQGHGLHDPPRHALRRHLHGRRARLRPRGRAGRGIDARGAASVRGRTSSRCRSPPRSSARMRRARRPACRSTASRSTR